MCDHSLIREPGKSSVSSVPICSSVFPETPYYPKISGAMRADWNQV